MRRIGGEIRVWLAGGGEKTAKEKASRHFWGSRFGKQRKGLF